MFLRFKTFYQGHRRGCVAGAVFLFAFILYAATAPHTIFTNDNPEFVTAAAIAGIPHPSGYPLYVIMTGLFARFPFFSIAYRVNLFSALCAAGSLVLLYFMMGKIFEQLDREKAPTAWALAALILPFSVTAMFWYQAVVGKTYALNLLLTLVAAYAAIKFFEERRRGWQYVFALVAGLGIANHLMFILTLPFLALLFVRRRAWNFKTSLICLALFVAGLAPYAYIPLRAAMHPLLNWGQVHDLPSFWNFFTRAQYNDLNLASSWADKLQYLEAFFSNIWVQFGWFSLLMPVGFVWIFKYARKWSYLLGAIILSNVLGIILLRNSLFNYAETDFNATYYLPAYAGTYLFCAVGARLVIDHAKKYANAATVVAFLSLSVYFFGANVASNDLRGFHFIDDLSRQTLLSLPPRSVFIINLVNAASDTYSFSLMYQKDVDAIRPDVNIIDLPDAVAQLDPDAVIAAYAIKDATARRQALYAYAATHYPNRPIFATFPFAIDDASAAACFVSRANGYAYGYPAAATAASFVPVAARDQQLLEQDVFGRQYLADYYYALAAANLKNAGHAAYLKNLDQALAEENMPASQQFVDFQKMRTMAGQ